MLKQFYGLFSATFAILDIIIIMLNRVELMLKPPGVSDRSLQQYKYMSCLIFDMYAVKLWPNKLLDLI